jgi:5'-methylthioadenosine phosphorylase
MNSILYSTGKEIDIPIINGGTYVCIEGPRFSTRAESKVFRMWGGDVIGMTCYPEVALAAEQSMCYSTIAMITDLDVWAAECDKCGIVEYGKKCNICGGPLHKLAVSIDEVLETMKTNSVNLKKLLETTIPKLPSIRKCHCKDSMKGAVI